MLIDIEKQKQQSLKKKEKFNIFLNSVLVCDKYFL